MRYSVHGFVAVALALAVAAPALAQNAVHQLEAELTASPSATQLLTEKCAALKLASPAVVKAVRENRDAPASAAVRAVLEVSADTPLHYRRVNLTCGGHVLSQADNWYVPSRLGADMNKTLDTTETSFGTVVKPLNFHRKTLKMEALDEPLHSLRVTAVLISGEGRPFSLVVENYSREITDGRR
ncbi:MAG TPA: hypothetical protein VHY57_11950 [Rhizomicrobium sp.]|nr:hypothetical protein [Rhizomicrobium sp.]